MGQNQRRPGFLRWGEGSRSESAEATVDLAEQEGAEPATSAHDAPEAASAVPATANEPAMEAAAAVEPTTTSGAEATPFLRDLVGAMRGVAESSRDTTLAELREAVEKRVEELGSGTAARAEELRRGSERDLDGIGEWERAELERVRREAEQRREARRAQLDKELTDHQAAADAEVEATRARLAQYEQELDAFFAQLSAINDPAAFVSAAKRMPPPPDLATATAPTSGQAAAKEAPAAEPPATPAEAPQPSDATLAERLAQLNERLGTAPAATEAAATDAAAAAATTPAVTAAVSPPTPSSNGSAAEASTPIVVKGLGSFGAITSFKQALERVDGISGVTLSLGPTGDFVYRASHAPEFDIVTAIRSIEGPSAGIEQVDGQLRVTIERPR
ncbi:MAG TPA: hypothetical protein VF071_07705 [Candidatus Limnocylindria bacterium]